MMFLPCMMLHNQKVGHSMTAILSVDRRSCSRMAVRVCFRTDFALASTLSSFMVDLLVLLLAAVELLNVMLSLIQYLFDRIIGIPEGFNGRGNSIYIPSIS